MERSEQVTIAKCPEGHEVEVRQFWHLGSTLLGYYISCARTCWNGPVKPTEEEAVSAWAAVMEKIRCDCGEPRVTGVCSGYCDRDE